MFLGMIIIILQEKKRFCTQSSEKILFRHNLRLLHWLRKVEKGSRHGKIVIGDDVLRVLGAYINFDVPSHSIVLGNPGVIHCKKCYKE